MDKHLKEIRIEANRQKTESARIKILKQSESLNHERNQFAKKIKASKSIKLKNLSLKGRGGGGSMKMPQEYSKRSLLKKPMS